MMNKIVRAVDVGYRLCKYVTSHNGRGIQCDLFPSIAPMASTWDKAEAMGKKRNTVFIPVGDLLYEVGPDAALALPNYQAHNLDNNYIESDEYLAIQRGALRYMGVPVIDLLIVGLPVSLVLQKRATLIKRLKGVHPVGNDKTVEVKEVRVLAQPQGALVSHVMRVDRSTRVGNDRRLIIDCGGRTFDWLVCQGLKVIEKRCDATPLGMYAATMLLAKAISQKLDTQFHDYERLEDAMKNQNTLQVFGNPFDLTPFMPMAKKIAVDAVTVMMQKVQDGGDIDQIIVVGGSAFFYKDEIKKRFPHHNIEVMADSVFTNVKGFQLVGSEIVAAEARRANQSAVARETV
jgi:plasmid segregation protein ParM